jgi:hypothetical protein
LSQSPLPADRYAAVRPFAICLPAPWSMGGAKAAPSTAAVTAQSRAVTPLGQRAQPHVRPRTVRRDDPPTAVIRTTPKRGIGARAGASCGARDEPGSDLEFTHIHKEQAGYRSTLCRRRYARVSRSSHSRRRRRCTPVHKPVAVAFQPPRGVGCRFIVRWQSAARYSAEKPPVD